LVGSLVTTALVLLKVGVGAASTVLPVFVVLTGLWIGLATPFALYFARRGRLNSRGVYAFATVSSLVAASAFFLFFVYFLMFCLPVAFSTAVLVFNFMVLRGGGPEDPLLNRVAP
jgi:hypothetical protein